MNINSVKNKTIRSLGGQMMKGHFWASLVFLIICEIMTRSVSMLTVALFPDSSLASYLADLYFIIIKGPLSFAAAIYFLWLFRAQPVGYNSFVHGFEYFKKDVTLYVSIFVRCFLLSILFVIPGIICFIRYSQAFYILADNPNKTVSQCMAESKSLMKHKGKKYISFIGSYAGWFFLSMIPQMYVVSKLFTKPLFTLDPEEYVEAMAAVTNSPVLMITEVFTLMACVYLLFGTACFFDIITEKLVLQADTCEENVE